MVDLYTDERRRQIMASIKSENTKPEKLIRSLLHSLGYRFRIHIKDLPGKPDIVFPKKKKVIFIHGCFWHGHENCKRATIPKTNTIFWEIKIYKNKTRDELSIINLVEKGWDVLVIWQCQLTHIEQLKELLCNFLGQ